MPSPLHDELRWSARQLARRQGRPRQANLRRAVSAGYYALFHLLVFEVIQTSVPSQPKALQAKAGRALQHGEMKEICNWFVVAKPPAKLKGVLSTFSPSLQIVAATFLNLQQARHRADYDTAAHFLHSDVMELLDTVDSAFSNWESIRGTDKANVFLTALVFGKRWDR